jgi:malonate-semialdehyde dehydrogenase (acetylating)/methylmalonate-semialdehyde dehydrogenase
MKKNDTNHQTPFIQDGFWNRYPRISWARTPPKTRPILGHTLVKNKERRNKMQELTHYINGAQVKGTSGRFSNVYNPATGEVQAKVPLASADEMAQAVEIAAAAQVAWGAVNPQRRARVMMKFVDLLNRDMDALAEALSREHGKTLPDAQGDVQRGLEVVEYCIGAPQMLKGDFTDSAGPGIDMYSMRQALGVCAGITPFNFPAMIPMWMFAPAIVCGNAFILKPSERDPSVPLMMAELMEEAGLPKGILQVVNGDKEAVDAILDHEVIQSIGFVGSTPIAEYIYGRGCSNGKRVQCFGGAKNHMIIMPDADMDQAADALIGAGYGAAGERCMAISVAVPVGDETADRLIEKLVPRIEKLKVGPYTSGQDVDYGPVVTAAAKQNILNLVQTGVDQGATLVVDGRDFNLQGYEDGFFVGPHLFDNVTPDMDIYTKEIFGPVLCTVRAGNYEEALGLAMDHEYGNGTAIFTRDGDAARDFANRINVGMVGINVPIPVPLAYHTFGGWKKSVFGDLNQHGPDAFKFYTRTKTVTARWPSGIKQGGEFNFKAMD